PVHLSAPRGRGSWNGEPRLRSVPRPNAEGLGARPRRRGARGAAVARSQGPVDRSLLRSLDAGVVALDGGSVHRPTVHGDRTVGSSTGGVRGGFGGWGGGC